MEARIASGPGLALNVDTSVIRYLGAVAIARVAVFYGMRVKPITELQRAEKYSTAGVERREGHPSKEWWRAVPPTPPLKGQGKGSGAYVARSSRRCGRNTIVILPLYEGAVRTYIIANLFNL